MLIDSDVFFENKVSVSRTRISVNGEMEYVDGLLEGGSGVDCRLAERLRRDQLTWLATRSNGTFHAAITECQVTIRAYPSARLCIVFCSLFSDLHSVQ